MFGSITRASRATVSAWGTPNGLIVLELELELVLEAVCKP
jgi:hypothetical protein